jgi:hypothetical protein
MNVADIFQDFKKDRTSSNFIGYLQSKGYFFVKFVGLEKKDFNGMLGVINLGHLEIKDKETGEYRLTVLVDPKKVELRIRLKNMIIAPSNERLESLKKIITARNLTEEIRHKIRLGSLLPRDFEESLPMLLKVSAFARQLYSRYTQLSEETEQALQKAENLFDANNFKGSIRASDEVIAKEKILYEFPNFLDRYFRRFLDWLKFPFPGQIRKINDIVTEITKMASDYRILFAMAPALIEPPLEIDKIVAEAQKKLPIQPGQTIDLAQRLFDAEDYEGFDKLYSEYNSLLYLRRLTRSAKSILEKAEALAKEAKEAELKKRVDDRFAEFQRQQEKEKEAQQLDTMTHQEVYNFLGLGAVPLQQTRDTINILVNRYRQQLGHTNFSGQVFDIDAIEKNAKVQQWLSLDFISPTVGEREPIELRRINFIIYVIKALIHEYRPSFQGRRKSNKKRPKKRQSKSQGKC